MTLDAESRTYWTRKRSELVAFAIDVAIRSLGALVLLVASLRLLQVLQ